LFVKKLFYQKTLLIFEKQRFSASSLLLRCAKKTSFCAAEIFDFKTNKVSRKTSFTRKTSFCEEALRKTLFTRTRLAMLSEEAAKRTKFPRCVAAKQESNFFYIEYIDKNQVFFSKKKKCLSFA
jgi:hypothetical protein